MTRTEEAKKWLREELERLHRAPDLNGCPMTQEWAEQIRVFTVALEAIEAQEAVTPPVRLIDANALLRPDESSDRVLVFGARGGKTLALAYELLKLKVEQAPTIEAKPGRHGRWIGIEYDGYADGFPVYDLWECSECGEEVRGEDVPQTHPFCHGCGAEMDGGAL